MLNEIIDKNFDDMLVKFSQIIRIPSIGSDAKPGMPYGEKCAEVLAKFLELASDEGFYTKNHDNYVGTIEYNKKPVRLGVLCHLDVVPVNKDDWTYDPFITEIHNGRIYGRGAIDNKGPAIAVLFALKAIKESGTDLTHNVRFIVGCDEERGSSDLEHYMKTEKMPPMVFTPDGDYPVINIEKGMLRLRFSQNIIMKHIKSISGGSVVNAVPAIATAVIADLSLDDIKGSNKSISILQENDVIRVTYKGMAAHASTPSLGDNAITGLIEFLRQQKIDDNEKNILSLLGDCFPHNDTAGTGLGIQISDDKSGALTEVLSIINYSNGVFECKMDIRYPVTGNKDIIINKVRERLSSAGFDLFDDIANNPHIVDENSEFIKTLLNVYHEQTGLETYCKAIGGGTYVHDIEGGVAFGAEFPGDINNMHGNDESITLESLKLNTKIIANAIYQICR